MGIVTKLIKNGELGSFISKGIYPAPLHEALSELQRKAESAFTYDLLDKVRALRSALKVPISVLALLLCLFFSHSRKIITNVKVKRNDCCSPP